MHLFARVLKCFITFNPSFGVFLSGRGIRSQRPHLDCSSVLISNIFAVGHQKDMAQTSRSVRRVIHRFGSRCDIIRWADQEYLACRNVTLCFRCLALGSSRLYPRRLDVSDSERRDDTLPLSASIDFDSFVLFEKRDEGFIVFKQGWRWGNFAGGVKGERWPR